MKTSGSPVNNSQKSATRMSNRRRKIGNAKRTMTEARMESDTAATKGMGVEESDNVSKIVNCQKVMGVPLTWKIERQ